MSMDLNPRKRRRLPTLVPAPDPVPGQLEPSQRPLIEIKYKRHQAAKACNACRQAKAKCSEDRPECQRCQTKGQECQYAIEDPGDNRKSMKEDLKSLQLENSSYKELIEYMKTATPLALGRIIEAIRNEASVEDLMFIIQDDSNSTLLPAPENAAYTLLGNSVLEDTKPVVHVPIQPNFGLLEDKRLVNLKMAPWATAAGGDEILSQLVSSFVSWDSQHTNFYDPKTSR
ncbi:hypothetical protein TWF106_004468 [Orbilia oligospora]|uniref:Zn(2)-C6 fungal-type domain-containing protein n=1 Tax=Orbilia oligospora TaxID=2813651 RepID=A0A6G1LVD1_ORBOL|nr:hypothetical protein TWF788_005537 [Orbilia oligospora]KAF3206009.1 hypothetical protein TWF191_001560 [Orbilia oligospora]KAF3224270.1 hypothetical protein TWF106_004468 [Orbilia oligospora]KAF3235700.1 hypothetical protein TWF192_000648 [Orbilia oligospora]